MTIPRPSTIRSKSPAVRVLAFGLVMLGLCVFAWGLRYKLSLYDPPRAVSHHMPAARLLTGKERNPALLAPSPRLATSVVPLAFSTLALALLAFATARSPLSLSRWQLASSPRPTFPASLRSPSSYVRPPPYLR